MSDVPVLSWRDAAGRIEIKGYDPARHKWVTQVGGRTFHEHPRWHREIALSTLANRVPASKAVPVVFKRPCRPVDQVRFFRIAHLIRAGYFPHPSPHLPHNPDHGNIRAPIAEDHIALHQAWWGRPERVTLESLASH